MDLDHLAVVAADLDEGTAWTEDRLGLRLAPGGRHAAFATHNRLLSLGPGLYLEVIAPDPDVPPPGRARWFGLDHAGAPALGNWIVRVPDRAAIPPGVGEILSLERGDLAWDIAVPADGSLPMAGGHPTVIAWTRGSHPSQRLPDLGARLVELVVSHPEADRLAARLAPQLADPRLRFVPAERPALSAVIRTPAGLCTL